MAVSSTTDSYLRVFLKNERGKPGKNWSKEYFETWKGSDADIVEKTSFSFFKYKLSQF